MNAHKDCGQIYFAPLLDCDCQVCTDARRTHDTAIRNATINELYQRIKAERDPSLEYVDWDSIEAVFIRLRDDVK